MQWLALGVAEEMFVLPRLQLQWIMANEDVPCLLTSDSLPIWCSWEDYHVASTAWTSTWTRLIGLDTLLLLCLCLSVILLLV